MFADDTKMGAGCKNDEDREKLQKDLESLRELSKFWRLRLKAGKCKG